MTQNRLRYGLLCEKWGQEEQHWFTLFADSFQRADQLELCIYFPDNNESNKDIIGAYISNKLKNHSSPIVVDFIELDDFRSAICDYWVANSFFKLHRHHCQSRLGVIENNSLEELEKSYSTNFPSPNAYEYDFLVDSYDFEKTGKGFVETKDGLVPRQFGSTGGQNFDDILSLLNQYGNNQAKILEVGCGVGAFYRTLIMNHMQHSYTGIDKSRKQIIRCRLNYPEGDFRVGDACNLHFEDNMYDFVFENNVIIFITDPFRAIDEMCRVASGYVYFTIHLLTEINGLYCYYPFSSVHEVDPQKQIISITPEQERFFSRGAIRHRRIAENKILAFTVKIPCYVPHEEEFFYFFERLIREYSLSIERERKNEGDKELFINPNKTNQEIVNDDCVVTKNDRLIKTKGINATYLLKKP